MGVRVLVEIHERYHLEDIGVVGRIILKWLLKYDGTWT
jgi:hypothetical protein